MTIRATYEHGILRPVEPLHLEEGQMVRVIVTPETGPWGAKRGSRPWNESSPCRWRTMKFSNRETNRYPRRWTDMSMATEANSHERKRHDLRRFRSMVCHHVAKRSRA